MRKDECYEHPESAAGDATSAYPESETRETDDGYSLGEILEIYTDRARVTFPIGNTFRGKPRPLVGMGYKTVKLSELRPVKEVSNSDY